MLVTASDMQAKHSGYTRVLIFRLSAGAVSGRLMAVEQDTLRVVTTSGEELIGRTGITRVIVRGEPRSGEGAGYGMLIGGYASVYLLGARDESGTFLHPRIEERPFVILFGLIPGVAIGAGVGFLVDSGSDGTDELFELSGSPESRQTEWRRLANVLKPQEYKKFHISAQGSHLFDFNFSDPFFDSPYDPEGVTRFNLVRKLQCTYSLLPEVEVGVALVPFGELGLVRYRYDNLAPDLSRSLSLTKTLKSTGYYLVAQYKPLRQSMPEPFELNIGAGIGWMSIDYHRNVEGSTYGPGTSSSSPIGPFAYADSRSPLSGIVFSEIAVRVYDGLTIGLVLDRLIVSRVTDPGEPSLGYGSTTLSLGTWSLGFNLGVHF